MLSYLFGETNPKGKVFVVLADGMHRKVEANCFAGRWYAAPYSAHTTCELLTNGEVDGASYIKSWKPITENVTKFYKGETNA